MGLAGRFFSGALSAGSAPTKPKRFDADEDSLPLLCQSGSLTGADDDEDSSAAMGLEFSGNAVRDLSMLQAKNGTKKVDVAAKTRCGHFERAGGLHWFTTALFIGS